MKELEKQQKDSDETSDRHFELCGNNDPLRNSGVSGITSAIKTPVTVREVNKFFYIFYFHFFFIQLIYYLLKQMSESGLFLCQFEEE
jgi:hypothetical protein